MINSEDSKRMSLMLAAISNAKRKAAELERMNRKQKKAEQQQSQNLPGKAVPGNKKEK
jgi:hypothetical protein